MCVMKKRSFLDTESLSAIIVLFFALITWILDL